MFERAINAFFLFTFGVCVYIKKSSRTYLSAAAFFFYLCDDDEIGDRAVENIMMSMRSLSAYNNNNR